MMINFKLGCVMFDLHDNLTGGKPTPKVGSGWCSIEGKDSFRFKSLDDIMFDDTYFITNMKQDALWKSGMGNNKKLKHSAYLRTDLGQMMKEIGLNPPKITISEVCQNLSMIFTKVVSLGINNYNILSLEQKDFYLEIKKGLNVEDKNISTYIDEALMRAYQDLTICNDLIFGKEYLVTLKKPRYHHAKQLLEVVVPETNNNWDFYGPDDLKGNNVEKLNFFLKLNRPFLVKIKINSIKDITNKSIEKLLNLGESIGDGGSRRERNWVCHPELLYLYEFADITIEAGFVAQSSLVIKEICNLPYLGELSDFSYSLGLLSECVWTGLATRSVNQTTRGKTLVSPRACWLKSADRYLTLKSAMILHVAGFKVISYGFGGVSVAINDSKLPLLIETAKLAELLIPINILDKIQNTNVR